MNFCVECKGGFELKDNPDYCESCRIVLGLKPSDLQDFPVLSDEERVLAISLYGSEWWRFV